MNTLSIFTKAAQLVTGAGVGMIISNAVKSTTPAEIKTYQKVAISVGSFVLGGLVAAKAEAYVEQEINSIVQALKDSVSEAESAVVVVEPTSVMDDTTTEDQNV